MQCSHCGFENDSSSTYCERCGTHLNSSPNALEPTIYHEPQTDFGDYNAPPPPPLNGHNSPPPPPIENNAFLPPPLETGSYSMQSQAFTNQKIISRPGPIIFSAILYFFGAFIAAFGLFGTIDTIGTDSSIRGTAFFLAIALLIASVVVFMRIRRRFPTLRWWQRVLWILGVTTGGFIALVIEALIAPGPTITSYFVGCVFTLYGLTWAAIAVW